MNTYSKIIILYGPPAGGKGTQAKLLKDKYPGYFHLDFGSEFRSFVQKHLGGYDKEADEINPNSTPKQIEVAQKVKKRLRKYEAVDLTEMRFIIEQSIAENCHRGMIIEGPGRTLDEANWLSNYFAKLQVSSSHTYLKRDSFDQNSGYQKSLIKNPKSTYQTEENSTKSSDSQSTDIDQDSKDSLNSECSDIETKNHLSISHIEPYNIEPEIVIFQLHVSMAETVKRSATRYYVPGIITSFASYKQAKTMCKEGQEPYRRIEDNDSVGITKRYMDLYLDVFAKILGIYQKNCMAKLYMIDASQDSDDIHTDIMSFLN